MKLLFDDDLVEEIVFLCANRRCRAVPDLQIRRFHLERERAYKVLDPDERQAAFVRVHSSWFAEWGFASQLEEFARAFPLLSSSLAALGFRKARQRSEDGAELYVNASNGRHGVVALRSQHFREENQLTRLLNHELSHLSDMVDPAFGYAPELPASICHSSARLARERYRLLWDISIDGRLIRSGKLTMGTAASRRAEFDLAFVFWPEWQRHETFEQLWNDPMPGHQRLLALATDPRDLSKRPHPTPGAACPLCGFPTFEWAELTGIDAALLRLVHSEFAHWSPEHGACKRCLEAYSIAHVVS
jgi:hypothetical protein